MLFLADLAPAYGEMVAYGFTGRVSALNTFDATRYFSLPISINDPVVGRFVFDTLSPVEPLPTSPSYLQHVAGGFQVTVGSHEFSTSDYTLVVINSSGSGNDIFQVRFSTFASGTLPINPPPLLVNGIPQLAARMVFVFNAPNTTINSGALPSALQLPIFGTVAPVSTNGFIANHGSQQGISMIVGALFPVPVPEPSGGVLACLGLAAVSCFARRRRSHRL